MALALFAELHHVQANINLLLRGGAGEKKKRKEKTMPFGVNSTRSPVTYRAAQVPNATFDVGARHGRVFGNQHGHRN